MVAAGDGVAGAVGQTLIAKVLEGLGVALADHIGGVVPIKDIDYLPGVAIATVVITGGGLLVVGHQGADGLFVAIELFQIGAVLILCQDGLGIGNGGVGHLDSGGVDGVFILATILLCHCHIQGEVGGCGRENLIPGGGELHRAAIVEFGFVEPVALIGAVHQDALHDFGDIQICHIGIEGGVAEGLLRGEVAQAQLGGRIGHRRIGQSDGSGGAGSCRQL